MHASCREGSLALQLSELRAGEENAGRCLFLASWPGHSNWWHFPHQLRYPDSRNFSLTFGLLGLLVVICLYCYVVILPEGIKPVLVNFFSHIFIKYHTCSIFSLKLASLECVIFFPANSWQAPIITIALGAYFLICTVFTFLRFIASPTIFIVIWVVWWQFKQSHCSRDLEHSTYKKSLPASSVDWIPLSPEDYRACGIWSILVNPICSRCTWAH